MEPIPPGPVLKIREPGSSTVRFVSVVKGSSWVLGRGPSVSPNFIALRNNRVSTTHARIDHDKYGQTTITDLRSTNGTFREGRKLKADKPYLILAGDTIHCGRVEITYADSRCEIMELSKDKDMPIRLGVPEPWPDGVVIVYEGVSAVAYRSIAKAANLAAPVLLTGETGTGKEYGARALHEWSSRSSMPFLPLNCATFAKNLIESELFGHKRGAFTGANTAKKGLVALADGGTLFLDEIGELPFDMQAKLLRYLDCREYIPVGETKIFKSSARIVVATNKNLREMVQRGNFREDLYYRISAIPINLPPLREYGQSLPDLAVVLLREYCRGAEKRRCFTLDLLDRIQRYSWPGNFRELRNFIIWSCYAATDDTIGTTLFDAWLRLDEQRSHGGQVSNLATAPPSEIPGPIDDAQEAMMKRAIIAALRRTSTVEEAGLSIGRSRSWMQKWMPKLSIVPDNYLISRKVRAVGAHDSSVSVADIETPSLSTNVHNVFERGPKLSTNVDNDD